MIRDWRNAAQRVLKFKREQPADKYLIVKYEDLHTDTKTEMMKVLQFLNLESTTYDFEQALNLPVVGSSVFKRGEGRVHWTPVMKTAEFNPLDRAAAWTRKQHERFNWLAKKELIQLGYEPIAYRDNITWWALWNRFQDWKFSLKVWRRRFRKLIKLTKRILKIYFGKK